MGYFWDDVKEFLEFMWIPVVLTVVFIVGGTALMVSTTRASYKYNCELDSYPSWRTTIMIDDTTYAYNPEKFCNTLRKKMAEDK